MSLRRPAATKSNPTLAAVKWQTESMVALPVAEARCLCVADTFLVMRMVAPGVTRQCGLRGDATRSLER